METTIANYSNASFNEECHFPPLISYTPLYAAFCSACFLFGTLYCFFGYRFFKATMFLTGFMFGALISYVVIQYETVVPVGGKIGILVAAGLLCGIITMLVQYVGLFMTGFMLGQLVAVMLLIILEQFFYHLSSRWIAIGILFGCGVVFALLNLYFRRGLTIISSSTIGAAAIAVGLDYFVEDFVMLNYIEARIHVEREGESVVCWYSWTLLAVWPLLSLVGIGIQWRVTGADIDYKDNTRIRRPKRVPANAAVEQRAAAVPIVAKKQSQAVARKTSYRQLYQIRRTNGDIISQSYLDNIGHRRSPDTVHLIRESPDS